MIKGWDVRKLSCEEKAEILRKKNRYRELILSGHLILPHARAAALLGPDCLYRLYGVGPNSRTSKKRRQEASKSFPNCARAGSTSSGSK